MFTLPAFLKVEARKKQTMRKKKRKKESCLGKAAVAFMVMFIESHSGARCSYFPLGKAGKDSGQLPSGEGTCQGVL